MNINQLKPASQLAHNYGVKCLAYGPPGGGKTPLVNTAPNPVLLVTEPGMLSMRNSNVPAWEAFTVAKIDEFFEWLAKSAESKRFDTVAVDSVSQMAEISLKHAQAHNRNGLKAYGDMARQVMEWLDFLYYSPQRHVFLIGKQSTEEELQHTIVNGMPQSVAFKKRKPYFPGNELNVRVPHLYDEILHIGKAMPPGVYTEQKVIRTAESSDILARDRSGKLAEYEPHDLTALFKKAMT